MPQRNVATTWTLQIAMYMCVTYRHLKNNFNYEVAILSIYNMDSLNSYCKIFYSLTILGPYSLTELLTKYWCVLY